MRRKTALKLLKFCTASVVLLMCSVIILGAFVGFYRQESVNDDSSIHGSYPAVRAASTKPVLTNGTLYFSSPIVDGVRIVTGDRVLLKNEVNPQLNGIYTRQGDVLRRSADMDRHSQVTPGNSVLVLEGTENGGASFMLFSMSAVVGPRNAVTGNGVIYRNSTGVALGSLIPPAPAPGFVLTYDPANPTTVKWVKSTSGGGQDSQVFTILEQLDNGAWPQDVPLQDQWVTRSINALFDPGGFGDVTLDSSAKTFTIHTAGLWYISASCPAYRCNQHKIRLVNAATAEELVIGSSAYSVNTNPTDSSNSVIVYTWNVQDVPLVLSIQHKVQLVNSNTSFGVPSSFGVQEVYSNIQLIKTS